MCRDSTGSHLFFKPLRYRLGCHLIATLVKRLWLSYTTGLHIPAARWIGILPKESPDRCGTCAICRTATAACLFTTSGSVVFLEFSHNQEGYYKWTKLSSLAQNAVANSSIAPRYLKVLTVLRELSVEIVVTL